MRVALAGRAAEMLIYGDDGVSAGCSQDLEVATRLATFAVTRYGMSAKTGPVAFSVLGEMVPSAAAADRVHEEITQLVRREEDAVAELLRTKRQALEAITKALVEYETVDGRRIAELVDSTGE
jgi:cell division protease FtsH